MRARGIEKCKETCMRKEEKGNGKRRGKEHAGSGREKSG